MKVRYVPLLPIQRELQRLPRERARFDRYLGTMLNADRDATELFPLVMANPMAKDHVTAALDALIALDADGVAALAAAEAASAYDVSGEFDAGIVVVDDLLGGWTNRYATEYWLRFEYGPPPGILPAWLKRPWVYNALWSSEPMSATAVREAMSAAVHRMAYVTRRGPARTLREKMAQEGDVLVAAGCAGPTLDKDDLEYTREVLVPYLDSDDKRTAIECLFGDAAAATLGFSPMGLSPWAGIALARHDATNGSEG